MENEVGDVDKLYDDIMAGRDTTATTASADQGTGQSDPVSATIPPAVQTQAQQEYEFKVNGKPIKAPIDKIIDWASKGYDAPNRIGALNKQIQELKAQGDKYKSYDETYKPIDEWARANPDKWKQLLYTWQTNQHNTQFAQLPPEIIEKLDRTQTLMDTVLQQNQQMQIAKEDQELDSEIGEARKQYPSIDFAKVDESGKTLEYRVLEYAATQGIKSFTPAFRAFYHDELVKQAEEKGKASLSANLQKQTREGFIGKTPTSTKEISRPQSVRNKSYSDLANEAIEELNAMGAIT